MELVLSEGKMRALGSVSLSLSFPHGFVPPSLKGIFKTTKAKWLVCTVWSEFIWGSMHGKDLGEANFCESLSASWGWMFSCCLHFAGTIGL